jgi:hypothetical protein
VSCSTIPTNRSDESIPGSQPLRETAYVVTEGDLAQWRGFLNARPRTADRGRGQRKDLKAVRSSSENSWGCSHAANISIPLAISVFPDELYEAPRSWAERAYPDNLIHYNRLDRGGHRWQ